ncbi:MAG: manganese efflux pump [Bacteroidales bacterium]|nr:manganese efflux pump [Bacteroidales bacterium]
MGIIEILLIAVAVSMDAFAVSICKGLSVSQIRPSHVLSTGLWFGGFQALMPLVGYFLGSSFAEAVSNVDHWIAFALLGFIGANMIKESFDKDKCDYDPDFSFKTMFVLAVATSIDALAVGVTFAFLNVDIWLAVLLIGVITMVASMLGVKVGNIFGCRYKSKAEFAGGAVLILMGARILIEHTLL